MFINDKPLTLNATFAYIRSMWEVEISESDFFFCDDNLPRGLAFFLNMRLCNNLRAFLKKFDFNVGSSPVDKGEKEEDLDEIYAFQNSDKVDSKLVPNMPAKVKLYLQKTRWHLKFNTADVADFDYYRRVKHKKYVRSNHQIVHLDHFFICSRNNRKGSILYPFSYEIKMDIGIDKLLAQHKKTGKPIFDISKLSWSVLLKVSKRKGLSHHDRSFTNNLVIESAQVYLNPASLLFYKFITLIQVVYGNYNYAYYKEAMMNYLRALRKRDAASEPVQPFIDAQLLLSTIQRHSDSSPRSRRSRSQRPAARALRVLRRRERALLHSRPWPLRRDHHPLEDRQKVRRGSLRHSRRTHVHHPPGQHPRQNHRDLPVQHGHRPHGQGREDRLPGHRLPVRQRQGHRQTRRDRHERILQRLERLRKLPPAQLRGRLLQPPRQQARRLRSQRRQDVRRTLA